MKLAIPVVWLAFAALFVVLGRAHWIESERSVPPFEVKKHAYNLSSGGFQVEIDVGGTPLDQPFENFAEDFNTYLEEQNRLGRAMNRRAAWAYFLASAIAIVSFLLALRDPGSFARQG